MCPAPLCASYPYVLQNGRLYRHRCHCRQPQGFARLPSPTSRALRESTPNPAAQDPPVHGLCTSLAQTEGSVLPGQSSFVLNNVLSHPLPPYHPIRFGCESSLPSLSLPRRSMGLASPPTFLCETPSLEPGTGSNAIPRRTLSRPEQRFPLHNFSNLPAPPGPHRCHQHQRPPHALPSAQGPKPRHLFGSRDWTALCHTRLSL